MNELDPQDLALDLEQLDEDDEFRAAHRELVYIELWYRRREMLSDPALYRLTIGVGGELSGAEFSIRGEPRDPYNGLAIFNPTSATISVGFQVGTAYLAPLTVPPHSFVTVPERYCNLSFALLNPADQAQTYTSPVTIMRLRVPPLPNAGPYGAVSAAGGGGGGGVLTAHNPGSAPAVTTAGGLLVAANSDRRELTITNPSAASWITLGLSSATPAVWAGNPIAPAGGSFYTNDYLGPVSAIANTANTFASVTEV